MLNNQQHFTVSASTLKLLAAVVWILGGIILLLKGKSLIVEANSLNSKIDWKWPVLLLGIVLGGLKAKYLFIKVCTKNLARINALENPQIWQFYRPRFFAFLLVMILTAMLLSKMAVGNQLFLYSLAMLDLSIAVALIASSFIFWKH